jgi:hypothetical protein
VEPDAAETPADPPAQTAPAGPARATPAELCLYGVTALCALVAAAQLASLFARS